jgi:threonine/homoserine/homoserine lactone efflux protein
VPAVEVLLSFVVASLALLLVPGPAVVYVINRGMVDGRTVALSSVLGLTIGNFFHAVLASVGISAILVASTMTFNIIKWLGVAYLVGTGVRTLASRVQSEELTTQSIDARHAFKQGATVNVLNPKVALFFLAFLPQFVDESSKDSAWTTLLFGCVFVGLGLITDSAYAVASSSLREKLIDGKFLPFFRRWVSGAVFVLLGIMAALVSRNA